MFGTRYEKMQKAVEEARERVTRSEKAVEVAKDALRAAEYEAARHLPDHAAKVIASLERDLQALGEKRAKVHARLEAARQRIRDARQKAVQDPNDTTLQALEDAERAFEAAQASAHDVGQTLEGQERGLKSQIDAWKRRVEEAKRLVALGSSPAEFLESLRAGTAPDVIPLDDPRLRAVYDRFKRERQELIQYGSDLASGFTTSEPDCLKDWPRDKAQELIEKGAGGKRVTVRL